MFNKDKKPNKIHPANQKPKDKQDKKNKNPGDNEDTTQEKAAMRSEGGKN